ncbi:MAG TPA: hypothetical protein VHL80_03910 [Polyangia bacterium]|nr:hypothetical protein [Polyangia bacterium]
MSRLELRGVSRDLGLFAVLAVLGAASAASCGNSTSALSHGGGGSGGSAGSGKTGGGGATGSAGKVGAAGSTGAGGGSATGTGGAGGAGGGIPSKIPIGKTQCSDGIDNDGDGLIDSADPECTGPADNDESSFATGIPGDNVDPCKQDCFFDGNSGMGDDGCQWQLDCDPLSTNNRCPYDPSFVQKHMNECSTTASQSQKCLDNCRKYVPNGCDCFGCCAVPGASTPIRLDPTCTSKDFNDPTKCSPCTQVTQCLNTCGRCEICVGKPNVPEDCTTTDTDGGAGGSHGDGGVATCEGAPSCVPGPFAQCPAGLGCVTGCCIPIVQ